MNLLALIPLFLVFPIAVYNGIIAYEMDKKELLSPKDPETGIRVGAEPIYEEGVNGEAVLLLHGYIGTPKDLGRLPQLLHEQGYTVYVPLLPGHGRKARDFSETTAENLKQACFEAFDTLKATHSKVHVVGFSMGGALASLTAEEKEVERLVLLAPQLGLVHRWYYILPIHWWHQMLSPLVPFTHRLPYSRSINNLSSMHDFLVAYDFASMKGTDATLTIGEEVQRKVHQIQCPILILHAPEDVSTSYEASKRLAEALPEGQVRLVTLQNSKHLICYDHDADLVEQEVVAWITQA